MLGKIIGIGLVAVLTLALIGGSAYILLRPAQPPTDHAAHGHGYLEAASGHGPWAGHSREAVDGEEHGHGHGWEDADGEEGRHGHGSEADHGSGEHPIETWTTVTGTVVALDPDLVLQTEEGEVVVHLGPEWYWDDQELTLNVGDQVAVTGFFEHDGLEATRVENLTTGQSLILRDEVGRPLWAGRGRRR